MSHSPLILGDFNIPRLAMFQIFSAPTITNVTPTNDFHWSVLDFIIFFIHTLSSNNLSTAIFDHFQIDFLFFLPNLLASPLHLPSKSCLYKQFLTSSLYCLNILICQWPSLRAIAQALISCFNVHASFLPKTLIS